jgi:SPP1 gp7 family putative phage head morphogenesis protein
MAKQLTLPKETAVKAVPYPKGFEKMFENMLVKMTTEASKYYFNNTIKKLNVGTINKFADAQKGNWAVIFNGLDATAKRALKKRFGNARINNEVSRVLHSLNRTNQTLFYESIEDRIGISVPAMIAQEGTGPQMNALVMETQKWVQKNLDDNLAYFANNSLRMMADGATYDELIEGYDKESDRQITNSRFIARNQLSSFNGLSNKIRYQKLGITEAIWQTSRDERVRPSHDDRDGKTYELSKGLYSSKDGKWLQVGTDWLCRCTSKAIIPEED